MLDILANSIMVATYADAWSETAPQRGSSTPFRWIGLPWMRHRRDLPPVKADRAA